MTGPWLLLAVVVAMAAVMSLAWAVQRQVRNSGWIDVFWTYGTGIAGAACALWPAPGALPARRILVAGLVAVWAIRLGTYIAVRVAKGPEDARYALFRKQWGAVYDGRLFAFVQPQALITGLLCLSILLAARRPAETLDWRDGLGVMILVVAIAGETIADRQLARFKATHHQKGGICDEGLWAWSRHPNYFFEWLGWLAYPVIALAPSRPLTWLSIAGPAAIYLVLRFVTGVPPLEAAMKASRGERFEAYRARTSPFLPLPPKAGARP